MQYLIVIEEGPTSFGTSVPDLPGCIAVGETRPETLHLIREAIEFHLEGLRDEGEDAPGPRSFAELVEVASGRTARPGACRIRVSLGTMIETQVALPESLKASLDRRAPTENERSELVSAALHAYLVYEPVDDSADLAIINANAEALNAEAEDALTYQAAFETW
jgi:predicted RNase H-like HicB family nuclease